MTGLSLFVTLLVELAISRGCHAAPSRIPDDVDWSALTAAAGPPESWHGLYINLTTTTLSETSDVMKIGQPDTIGGDSVLDIPFYIGFQWQQFQDAVDVNTAISAVQGCTTTDGSTSGVANCAIGLASTITSLGVAYQTSDKPTGWFTYADNSFTGTLQDTTTEEFTKRSQDMKQSAHEHSMVNVLRDMGLGEPEFLGYADARHRLSRRDEDYLHPRAPMYRIRHRQHGLMDIVSRDHINFTSITATFANDLVKRQLFDQQGFSNYLMEGRFDYDLSTGDPNDPSFTASGGFPNVNSWIACMSGLSLTDASWLDKQVISTQFYDTVGKATFGFASVGIFEAQSSNFAAFTPVGLPLPGPTCGPPIPTNIA